MDGKAISKRLETFFNEKIHIEMQNTPRKQENNVISMAQKTENQLFFLQIYTTLVEWTRRGSSIAAGWCPVSLSRIVIFLLCLPQ